MCAHAFLKGGEKVEKSYQSLIFFSFFAEFYVDNILYLYMGCVCSDLLHTD